MSRAWLAGYAAFLLAGCGHSNYEKARVLEIAARANGPNDNGGIRSERLLEGLKLQPVRGYDAIPRFNVVERSPSMQKFPCAKCHVKPLEQLQKAQQGKKASHWDVTIVHAPEATMNCATCHLKKDLNQLATINGATVDLNHGYQVCAQCHSRQALDWAGGAHGKRAGGWAPPRAVYSCTHCHNPHKPKLEPRWPSMPPATAARQEKRRQEGELE